MKILLFFILFVFYNNTSSSEDFSWNKVVTSKDGSNEFYFDRKSIRSIGNYNYQWLMTNYLKGTEEVKSDISYVTVDCKKNRIQIVIWSEYSENDAQGQIRGHSLSTKEELEWYNAKDGTITSALVESSCKNKIFSLDNTGEKNKNSKTKRKSKYKEF